MRIIAYPKVFPFSLLMVLGGLLWWLEETSRIEVKAEKTNANHALVTFDVTSVRFNQAGQPVDKLICAQMRYDQNKNVLHLFSPRLEHQAEPDSAFTVSAGSAVWQQNTNILFMQGMVKIMRYNFANQQPVTLYTSSATVDLMNQTAYSKEPLQILSGQNSIRATGFYWDNVQKTLRLHQIKGRYEKAN